MTEQEFWDRYNAIGEDSEEPGLPLSVVIERLESLAADLRTTGLEMDEQASDETEMMQPPSAQRAADEIEVAAKPDWHFPVCGGKISFSNGTYIARLFGVSASCTVSEADAVKAWIRAVRRKAGAA